jgi:hypothetical protein
MLTRIHNAINTINTEKVAAVCRRSIMVCAEVFNETWMRRSIIGQTLFFCFGAIAMVPNMQKSIDPYGHSLALPLKYHFFTGDFALWCNALACKQIASEDAGTLSVKTFLSAEIDEHKNQTMPCTIKYKKASYDDQRLARRWRMLEIPHDMIGIRTELGSRHHINMPFGSSSSDDDDSSSDGLYDNTIPVESAMLDAAVHADSSEKIWVQLRRVDAINNNSNHYPLHILWVEHFEQPKLLLKKMVPGNNWDDVLTNTAVIIAENDASFRIYRPKGLFKSATDSEKDSTQSPCNNAVIETYSLARITQILHHIPFSYLMHWYAAFTEFGTNSLTHNNLAAITWQMRLMTNRYCPPLNKLIQ